MTVTGWRRLGGAAAANVVLVMVAGCGGGSDDAGDDATSPPPTTDASAPTTTPTTAATTPTTAPTTAAPTTTAPTTASPSPTAGSGGGTSGGGHEFEAKSSDGTLDIDGDATVCKNPDESTLTLRFADDAWKARVDVKGGKGRLTVIGGPEYEGRITSFVASDDGRIRIRGNGGAADDSAAPSTFTVRGRCG